MKDFYGTEIKIGDEVACISSRAREFERGKVVSVGKKTVDIQFYDGGGARRMAPTVIVRQIELSEPAKEDENVE